jgi:hypothetical protein
MCNELGRLWKETVVANFNVLSQHLAVGTEENRTGHLIAARSVNHYTEYFGAL